MTSSVMNFLRMLLLTGISPEYKVRLLIVELREGDGEDTLLHTTQTISLAPRYFFCSLLKETQTTRYDSNLKYLSMSACISTSLLDLHCSITRFLDQIREKGFEGSIVAAYRKWFPVIERGMTGIWIFINIHHNILPIIQPNFSHSILHAPRSIPIPRETYYLVVIVLKICRIKAWKCRTESICRQKRKKGL